MTDDQLRQLLKDVRYLKDRQAILDVIMRHARGHDRHDIKLMNSCFWDDGVDEHGQFVTPGPGYGDWANKTHTAGFFLHMHNITNHTCEIDGDTAHCELPLDVHKSCVIKIIYLLRDEAPRVSGPLH